MISKKMKNNLMKRLDEILKEISELRRDEHSKFSVEALCRYQELCDEGTKISSQLIKKL